MKWMDRFIVALADTGVVEDIREKLFFSKLIVVLGLLMASLSISTFIQNRTKVNIMPLDFAFDSLLITSIIYIALLSLMVFGTTSNLDALERIMKEKKVPVIRKVAANLALFALFASMSLMLV